MARHALSLVRSSFSGALTPMGELVYDAYVALMAEGCEKGYMSSATIACYRAATSDAAVKSCDEAQTDSERRAQRKLNMEALPYLPDVKRTGTREEVQAELAVPIWGHPPASGDTFAACEGYADVLRALRACPGYSDQHLEIRIRILEYEATKFSEMTPRVRGMWLGYCRAEAAQRTSHWPHCVRHASVSLIR